MGTPTDKPPILVSLKAAQRLAAIYRQHHPNQAPLAFGARLVAAQALDSQPSPHIRAAVLDEPLQVDQDTSADMEPSPDWRFPRDVHSEICMTCNTLRKLQVLHGTIVEVISFSAEKTHGARHCAQSWDLTSAAIVQVSCSPDSSAPAHLARVMAVDAQHYSSTVPSDSSQQGCSLESMTAPSGLLQEAPKGSCSASVSWSDNKEHAWEDDVAYLAPALAFNMNLQHELWPFMPQMKPRPSAEIPPETDVDYSTVAGALTDGLAKQRAGSKLFIRPLRQMSKLRLVPVPQSGMFLIFDNNAMIHSMHKSQSRVDDSIRSLCKKLYNKPSGSCSQCASKQCRTLSQVCWT